MDSRDAAYGRLSNEADGAGRRSPAMARNYAAIHARQFSIERRCRIVSSGRDAG